MQKILKDYLEELNRKQKRRRKAAVAAALAAIMLVSGVLWNLTQYGITMTGEPKCGIEEHQHSEDCYTEVLACGLEESAGHTHTEECFKEESELVCGQEEAEGHTHTDECFKEESELICGQEENEEHQHSESCYKTIKTQICGKEESTGHTHGESCYKTVKTQICEQEESEGHTHTEACYEKQLTCGKEEHTHSDACFIDKAADTEDASVWDAQYADTEWKGAWGEDLVKAASKQIGYKESTDNYSIAEDGSHKGYTRYGQFAGDLYADWDAAFVNFCMHYAGLETSKLFPGETKTAKWYDKFAKGSNSSYLTAPAGYEPQAGDLVFFQKDQEETESQMGIVSSYNKEKNEIKVIEGNSNDAVKENQYAANDTYITAYLKISELEAAYKNPNAESETAEETDKTDGTDTADETKANEADRIIIEQEPDVSEEEPFAQTAETKNYVVTVKYGSETKLPENAELKVVEFERESEEFIQKTKELGYEPAWLLDIGFFVEGKEVEPQAKVNVEVKIRDTELLSEYDIVHFSSQGTEELDGTGQLNEAGEVVIKFTAESFSMFAGGQEKKPGSGTTGMAGTSTEPEPDQQPGTLGAELLTTGKGKNNWQIVAEGYQGNSSKYKKTTEDDMIRLQKNVVPTDVENEFLVYLSVDVNSWWQNFFENVKYQATESNKYHANDVGKIKDMMPGAWGVDVSKKPVPDYWSNTFRIVREANGETLAETTLYFSKANNVTMFIQFDNSNFLLLGVDLDSQVGAGVREVYLNEDTITEILKLTERYSVQLNQVTDTMGDYVEFQEVVNQTSGTSVTVTSDKRSFIWDVSSVSTPDPKDGWDTNVAELVYRVKLNVKQDDFKSCANNMDSTTEEPESYKVNNSANLDYTLIKTKNNKESGREQKSATFQVPFVRGLLYNHSFVKKGRIGDKGTGWVLPDAEFKLEKKNADENRTEISTVTSDDDGKVAFKNLEWGTYIVTETNAPEGYEKLAPYTVDLCYTTGKDQLEQDKTDLPNMILKKAEGETEVVKYNKLKPVNITVQKIWDDNDNQKELRPETITVRLEGTVTSGDTASEIDYDFYKSGLRTQLEQQLQGKTWNYTWENLPARDINGNLIEWSVVEETSGLGNYHIRYQGYVIPEEFAGDAAVTSSNSTEGNESKTYYIVNELKQDWSIVKRSSSDPDSELEGAEFELKDDKNIFYGQSKTNGIVEWFTVPGRTPESEITALSIPDGTYTLTETKAPSGYLLSKETWTVTIGSPDGLSIKCGGDDVSHDKGSNTWVYTFENEVLYSLPSTGGAGIYWYIFGGILLMAAATLIVYKNKCREVVKS